MTPNDPLARAEGEAREMLDCDAMCAHPEGDVERCAGRMCPDCIDAYKAAILARVRDKLERCERFDPEEPAEGGAKMYPRDIGDWVSRSDVLATLERDG